MNWSEKISWDYDNDAVFHRNLELSVNSWASVVKSKHDNHVYCMKLGVRASYTGLLSSADSLKLVTKQPSVAALFAFLGFLEGFIESSISTSHSHQWKVKRNKKEYSREGEKSLNYSFVKRFPTFTLKIDIDLDGYI